MLTLWPLPGCSASLLEALLMAILVVSEERVTGDSMWELTFDVCVWSFVMVVAIWFEVWSERMVIVKVIFAKQHHDCVLSVKV